jgi:hypothetical protein
MGGSAVVRLAGWRVALLVGVVGALGAIGCSDATGFATNGQDGRDDGSRRGELSITIADRVGGRSETRYALRDALGVETPLRFDAAPVELEPGARLKVWGVPEGDGLRVTSFEPLPAALEAQPAAIVAAPTSALRTFAFVFVDIGGGVTGTTTPAVADGFMTTNADSIRSYFLADSYRRQDIATYVTPAALKYPMTDCDTGTVTAMADALRPQVGNYQHYLWYFASTNAACGWNGLASLGTPSSPSRDTWFNHDTSCAVLVQEPGHNLGMQHASSLACPGATFADDPNSCSDDEYGDPFDPMGTGCRHMNAWQKAYQGWLDGCNGVKVSDSGTFNVLPLEATCHGAQFLQIKSPKARTYNRPAGGGVAGGTETLSHYYVELRTPRDFDGSLARGSRPLEPMVLIHVAGDLRTRSQGGLHTFLLDMTPSATGFGTFSDAALAVGQTFTDPAGGLSITAQAVSAAGATIVVRYASGSGYPPVCLDGSRFTAPGPGIEACTADAGDTGGGAAGDGDGSDTGNGSGTAGEVGPQPAGASALPAAGAGGCSLADGPPAAGLGLLVASLLLALPWSLVTAARRSRRSSRPGSARAPAPRRGQ